MLKAIRAVIVLVLIGGLLVAAYAGYQLFTEKPVDRPQISRVTGTTHDGWQQVTYRGLDLEVPPGWKRLDMSGCKAAREHWGPAQVDPCARDLGLWFKPSASFDPATGRGMHKAPKSHHLPKGGWTGYVTRGDLVVDVADARRGVVRRILRSVSPG